MSEPTHLDAWHIAAEAFPRAGEPEQQLRYLAAYAILAPSIHNTQPWRFRLGDEHVELWSDETGGLPVVDPLGRELVISCGAALLTKSTAIFEEMCSRTIFKPGKLLSIPFRRRSMKTSSRSNTSTSGSTVCSR